MFLASKVVLNVKCLLNNFHFYDQKCVIFDYSLRIFIHRYQLKELSNKLMNKMLQMAIFVYLLAIV